MLAVVSAVVAFDRWPGANVETPIQTLVLTDKAPPIRVSANSTAPSATPAARTAAGRTGAGAPRATPNLGGVQGERIAGGVPTTERQTGVGPAAPAVPAVPAPQLPDADPLLDPISNPDTTAGQVADGTQAVTDAAGVSLGRVSPDVGNTVAGTGQAVSQTIREIPLPDHIIPGH